MTQNNIILPTAYFPPVEYFVHILNVDEIFIEKHEHYIKQTIRNRCNIYSPNGVQALSIPVSKPKGNKTMTKDIVISYHGDWQINHRRSIETAYNSSPYFLYYKDELLPFFNQKFENLLDFNCLLLNVLMDLIGIRKKFNFTNSYITIPADLNDFRNHINNNKPNLNPNPNPSFPVYRQVYSDKYGFKPNLSIIDLLFNEGPSAIDYLNKCMYL